MELALVSALFGVALLGTVVVLVAIYRARRDTVSAQAVLNIIDGADNPDDGPACTHPGCMRAREELRRLAASPHPYNHPH